MMIEPSVLQLIKDHAGRDMPREACGVIIVYKGKQRYIPCANLSDEQEHFLMDPLDYAKAEDQGDIIVIVHSHPYTPPMPSEADRAGIESSGLPWLILNTVSGEHTITGPSGYVAPLYGRQFVHGIHDCYGLARDLYKQELGLEIPDFFRQPEWWHKGEDLLTQNLESAGFQVVPTTALREYDGVIMQISASVPNHVGVYLPGNQLAHHFSGRLSTRDVYGYFWRDHTVKVVRHRTRA